MSKTIKRFPAPYQNWFRLIYKGFDVSSDNQTAVQGAYPEDYIFFLHKNGRVVKILREVMDGMGNGHHSVQWLRGGGFAIQLKDHDVLVVDQNLESTRIPFQEKHYVQELEQVFVFNDKNNSQASVYKKTGQHIKDFSGKIQNQLPSNCTSSLKLIIQRDYKTDLLWDAATDKTTNLFPKNDGGQKQIYYSDCFRDGTLLTGHGPLEYYSQEGKCLAQVDIDHILTNSFGRPYFMNKDHTLITLAQNGDILSFDSRAKEFRRITTGLKGIQKLQYWKGTEGSFEETLIVLGFENELEIYTSQGIKKNSFKISSWDIEGYFPQFGRGSEPPPILFHFGPQIYCVRHTGELGWSLNTGLIFIKSLDLFNDGRILVLGGKKYWLKEGQSEPNDWSLIAYGLQLYNPERELLHQVNIGDDAPKIRYAKYAFCENNRLIITAEPYAGSKYLQDLRFILDLEDFKLKPISYQEEENIPRISLKEHWSFFLNGIHAALLYSPTGNLEDCTHHLNYSSSRKSVLEDLGRTQDFEELRALHKNCIEQDREIIETMEKEYLLLETAWEEPHYIVSHSILFHWEKAENEYGTVSWSFPEINDPITIHYQGYKNPNSGNQVTDYNYAYLCQFEYQGKPIRFQETYRAKWSYNTEESITFKRSFEVATFAQAEAYWKKVPEYSYSRGKFTMKLEFNEGLVSGPYTVIDKFYIELELNPKTLRGKITNFRFYDYSD